MIAQAMAHLEREIKLRFDDPGAARLAVIRAGGVPHRDRRLQQDVLLDTPDGFLRERRSALRVRTDSNLDGATLTFKGPVLESAMKLREEIETTVDGLRPLLEVLNRLGFATSFRCEKYREEFAAEGIVIAVDETPAGTFVELEGAEEGIGRFAAALGRTPADYIRDSYRGLFVRYCEDRGLTPGDMLFARG